MKNVNVFSRSKEKLLTCLVKHISWSIHKWLNISFMAEFWKQFYQRYFNNIICFCRRAWSELNWERYLFCPTKRVSSTLCFSLMESWRSHCTVKWRLFWPKSKRDLSGHLSFIAVPPKPADGISELPAPYWRCLWQRFKPKYPAFAVFFQNRRAHKTSIMTFLDFISITLTG